MVTANDSPAAARITLNLPVGPPESFALAPGEAKSLLTGTPFATGVTTGSGGVAPTGSAGKSAQANAASVHTLSSFHTSGGNGIGVTLASTKAKAVPALLSTTSTTPTSPTSPAPPVVGATSVHTGEFWANPLAGVILGAGVLFGLGLIERDWIRRFARHFMKRLNKGAVR
jgi:hypothetical protein